MWSSVQGGRILIYYKIPKINGTWIRGYGTYQIPKRRVLWIPTLVKKWNPGERGLPIGILICERGIAQKKSEIRNIFFRFHVYFAERY